MRMSDWSSDVCSSDLLENGWGADFDFCRRLAAEAKSVLELGCGTGELAVALSEGCDVVGVDPAQAMIEVARRRPGGDRATWIEADARDHRLGRRFDMVMHTGQALQGCRPREDKAEPQRDE